MSNKKKSKVVIKTTNNSAINKADVATNETVDGAEDKNIEVNNNEITIEEVELPQEEKVIEKNGNPTLEEFSHIYRVRAVWERPDTQVFASPIYEDALEVAKKYEGYKVYIDDDGIIETDPWENVEEDNKEESNVKDVIHPIPGKVISLNNTPLYASSFAYKPYKYLTGDYYFYDITVTNKRVKITDTKVIKYPDPSKIIGYIEI